jgi:putative membrane protein
MTGSGGCPGGAGGLRRRCKFALFPTPAHSGIIGTVRYWIIHWVLSGIALLIVAQVLPGIEVDSLGAALIAALVIGLVSATVGFVLKIVLLPFIILSLGIVYFLINGLMLKLASALVPGFRVVGCLPAVLGSILLTIVDYILNRLIAR